MSRRSGRRVHHPRGRVKYFRRTLRLNGECGGRGMGRVLWRHVDPKFAAGCVASDFGRKLGTGRADFELLNWEIFARFHNDRLRLGWFTGVPVNQRWLNLEQFWQHRFQREHRCGMSRIIRFDGHRFYLCPGAIADFESGGDFAFFARPDLVLLCLRSRAPTRGVDGLEADRRVTCVLILEMADCLLVGDGGVQFDLGLFPFQFRACGEWKQHRQRENEDAIFHFWKYKSLTYSPTASRQFRVGHSVVVSGPAGATFASIRRMCR
jgi:hypothetical protein